MTKWSRQRARPVRAAEVSWLEVTPAIKARRLGRARSCAAGVIAGIVASAIWATAKAPSIQDAHDQSDLHDRIDSAAQFLAGGVWGLGFWAFVIATVAWYLAVERRMSRDLPGGAGLWGDGWLVFGTWFVGALLSSVRWPFPVVGAVDEARLTFSYLPAAAGANGILGFTLLGAFIVLGIFAITRLAERRDAAAASDASWAGGHEDAA